MDFWTFLTYHPLSQNIIFAIIIIFFILFANFLKPTKKTTSLDYRITSILYLLTVSISAITLLNTALNISSMLYEPIKVNPKAYYNTIKYGLNNGFLPVITQQKNTTSRSYPRLNSNFCFIDIDSEEHNRTDFPYDIILYHELSHCIDSELVNHPLEDYPKQEQFADVLAIMIWDHYNNPKDTNIIANKIKHSRELETMQLYNREQIYLNLYSNRSQSAEDTSINPNPIEQQKILALYGGILEIKDFYQINDHYSGKELEQLMELLPEARNSFKANQIDHFIHNEIL